MLAYAYGEILFYVWVVVLEFGEECCVGEVERMGVRPILFERLFDAMDDVLVVDLDGELAPAVEAAGCEIDGANDGAGIVGENQFGVQLDVLKFVDLDAEILESA